MSEGPTKRRWLPFSPVVIPFLLVWACMAVAICVFIVYTGYRSMGLAALLLGMTQSGAYLARRTGGMRRLAISKNPISD